MKHQYFGDINDYAKYSILRAIAKIGDLSVALCWMLTQADQRSDGRHVTYVAKPTIYRERDPELFDFLSFSLGRGVRNVHAIERSGLLGNCAFYARELGISTSQRASYFNELWAVARKSEVVFFDPDNGWEVSSVGKGRQAAVKYLYWQELDGAFDRGHSALVYQHFPRVSREEYVHRLLVQVGVRYPVQPFALTTSAVAFVFIPQPRHLEQLRKAAADVVARWAGSLTLCEAAGQLEP